MSNDENDRLRSIIQSAVENACTPTMLRLLETSENRIAKTNKMIEELSKTTAANEKAKQHLTVVYDSHIRRLEEFRDSQQKTIEQLSAALATSERCHRSDLAEWQSRYAELDSRYHRLTENYVRLTEMMVMMNGGIQKDGSSEATVSIYNGAEAGKTCK